MFFRLLFLLTIIPFIELMLLLVIGKYIGIWTTLTIIVVTGILGAALARVQGFRVFSRIRDELNQGKLPADALLDGLLIFIGAILLVSPGFLTDLVGFILLLPLSRKILRPLLQNYLRRKLMGSSRIYTTSSYIYDEGKRIDI